MTGRIMTLKWYLFIVYLFCYTELLVWRWNLNIGFLIQIDFEHLVFISCLSFQGGSDVPGPRRRKSIPTSHARSSTTSFQSGWRYVINLLFYPSGKGNKIQKESHKQSHDQLEEFSRTFEGTLEISRIHLLFSRIILFVLKDGSVLSILE